MVYFLNKQFWVKGLTDINTDARQGISLKWAEYASERMVKGKRVYVPAIAFIKAGTLSNNLAKTEESLYLIGL